MSKFHHSFVILISAIQLTACELGVMRLINALVSKIFTYFKHSQNASY